MARDVHFGYRRDRVVLDGVDIEVGAGSSAALMAPSGAGKSTLLTILGGLRRPWSGSVVLTEAGSDGDLRQPVSWVFQAMHLMGRRTVVDNVAIAALARGHRRGDADVVTRSQLSRFGVGHLAERPQRDLSGGESQRVALARAAVADPLVVLADEPTANLDRANADLVIDVLFGGFPHAALVVATHDPLVAARADVIYRLESGRLRVDKGTA